MPQKPGNSPGSGPAVVQRQRIAKERAGEEQLGKLGEEEEPATEQRKECIDSCLDLGKTEE